ncbi:MAG: plastoquinol--plastocyanin reductase [Acidobacteria bacterium RBG_13_68_16]|jgi:Rieske Fe-S protein|nr:MAG: plastoquinol--plastocyanin reductase [Acidobacteria bacterium RBG_13_68_16]
MPGSDESSAVSRRGLLTWLLGTSLVATLVAALYPVFRFVMPPEVVESPVNRVLAGTLSELPPNSGKIFRFGPKPGILIRTPNGDVRAFAAVCTHLACTVQYRPDMQNIWCACHNGHYDLQGKNIAGPPPRPLEAYKVDIAGNDVYVTRGA